MKTGLFFGSFNPIHIGHMAIANYMLSFTDLDECWFIVSPHNPLKKKASLLADRQRLEMVRMAIGDSPGYRVSDIEFGLPHPSYTINSLAYLKERYPDRNFVLIMGSDNLNSIHKWKNFERIIEEHQIYVYPRPGDTMINTSISKKPGSIVITRAPIMEISSAFIRNAIKEGKDISHFLPEKVNIYIEEMHFYEK